MAYLQFGGFEHGQKEDGQCGAETREGHVEDAKSQGRWQQSFVIVRVVEQVDGTSDGQEEDQQLDGQAVAGAQ